MRQFETRSLDAFAFIGDNFLWVYIAIICQSKGLFCDYALLNYYKTDVDVLFHLPGWNQWHLETGAISDSGSLRSVSSSHEFRDNEHTFADELEVNAFTV